MENYRLSELLDLAAVQNMADANYEATGIPTGIIDAFDNSLLVGAGWQEICCNFHRANKKSLKQCQTSDNFIKTRLVKGEACCYKCKNGLWDIGIPIIVTNQHLATLFLGQFFYKEEPFDRNFFIQQAKKFGYDLDGYLTALDKVPVLKRKKVEYIIEYNKSLVTFLTDLAENSIKKKIAEGEVNHLRNYLSNIFDSMPSVLVGVDDEFKVTQWNRTASKITGISANDAKGKIFSDVLPGMNIEMETITESIQARETRHLLKKPRKLKNETCYEDITIYPLIANGIKGVVIRIDDVTQNVRMEEMMIQNEKMLSIGGLAAGMAHEINNPLAGMLQTANVMSNRLINCELPANLDAAHKSGTTMENIKQFMEIRGIYNMINAINKSGQRVSNIIDNMLNFVRKSDGRFSCFSISELIDKTLELAESDYDLKKKCDFKRIDIKKEYADNIPPVPCEGAKIQQVLLNIFRNGFQAMQENKENKPRFIVRTWCEKSQKMVCIEIEDNGTGMDEGTKKKIFEPFFTTKPVGSGTGLGLFVSYFIITENHGGQMEVDSTLGQGTKFIIRLPIT
ncbi:PocR ligand-binding domain-containing protein [Desulfobacula toluolica]|uniref:histidine kinase n=1 Tax=Desulfobacula toluolica (strain DSM 7467 / Tol2) TaxID=651182 RepID=K0NIC5_DESTT|nr:PocR ligand-binding domain-containing protein [Desulfobacula toluolica]CCK81136.1 two component system sensor histidine kinase [Desulfobacula toluolica Tol2]